MRIPMELHELAKQADSKETFLKFVAALQADWEASRIEEKARASSPYGPAPAAWKIPTWGVSWNHWAPGLSAQTTTIAIRARR